MGDDSITVSAEDARSDTTDALVDLDRWTRLAESSLHTEGASGELTLVFVDNDDIAALNSEHMGKTGPTDVLSFPMDDDPQPGVPQLLGDVIVAPAVAMAQFAEHAGTYDDEIALLVVHGVLHVLGHDHAEPGETQVMRDRERALLVEHHWRAEPPPGFSLTHTD